MVLPSSVFIFTTSLRARLDREKVTDPGSSSKLQGRGEAFHQGIPTLSLTFKLLHHTGTAHWII